MKKVITILSMVFLMVIMVAMGFVKAETDDVKIEGAVYGAAESEVYGWLAEWIDACGDERALTGTLDENGYYRGFGVVDACWFEEEYGVECSVENMRAVLESEYDLDRFDVVTAGFYDDYTVYKMVVGSKNTAIGNHYDYDINDWVYYYEGEMYFMVVYEY